MGQGIKGLEADLRRQFTLLEDENLYRLIFAGLTTLLTDQSALFSPLADAWAGRSFDAWHARPLLLAAALRHRALDGTTALSAELTAGAPAPELDRRLAEALADPELIPLLRDRVLITNEPGRALAWGLVARLLNFPARGWALVDLGASAGLSLVTDLTPTSWRLGADTLEAFSVPSPGLRWGVDHAPIDLDGDGDKNANTIRWMRACIWAGETTRLARLDTALSAWRRFGGADTKRLDRPQVHQESLGSLGALELLERAQAAMGGGPIIAFQSMVHDALPDLIAAAHDATLHEWLAGDPKRLWVRFEPAHQAPLALPAAIEVRYAKDGALVTLALGRARFHPESAQIDHDAVAALRADLLPRLHPVR